jgi:DNA invertase Pin-like site-specific DNA recombinase
MNNTDINCYEYMDDDDINRLIKEEQRRQFEEKRNIYRDEKGRLNKGAQLNHKESCNSDRIWLMYCSGMSIDEIMKIMKCSRSSAYRIIKKNKDNRKASNWDERGHDEKIDVSVELWDRLFDLL